MNRTVKESLSARRSAFKTKTVTILIPEGLHLRTAAQVVKKCKDIKSEIVICNDCKIANGCSIIELLLLEAVKDSQLVISARGEDEDKAIEDLSQLFEGGAGI